MALTPLQLRFLVEGLLLALAIAGMAAVVGLVCAIVGAFASRAPWRPVRWLATAYVEVFRGTSAFVQLFFLFYVLPAFGISLPPIATGVAALGLNAGAYGTEVVRSAIANVDKGQREAAIAINLSAVQAMRLVILPQAIVMMLPSLANFLISLILSTSLLSLITVSELTFRGRQLIVFQGQSGQTYLIIGLLYFLACYPISRLVKRLERRQPTSVAAR